jgi:TonB family protein
MRILAEFLTLCALFFSAPLVSAQQEELQKVAAGLAEKIAPTGKTRIAVMDAATSDGTFTELGRTAAFGLAVALKWEAPQLDSERSTALSLLARESPQWVSQLDDTKFSQTVGERCGCEAFVLLTLDPRSAVVFLSAKAIDAKSGSVIGQVSGALPRTPKVESLLGRKLCVLGSAAQAERSPLPPGVYRSGKDGVSAPKCVYCPDPKPTDELRKRKINAVLLLELIVREDGSASDVRVLRGIGYGMDEEAVRVVSAWRFSPGKLPNGTPVPVQTVVEVTVRFM